MLRLTPTGMAKLARAVSIGEKALKESLSRGCTLIVKPKIANRAPTATEEATQLSTGRITVSTGPQGATGIVGSADERRFKKIPGKQVTLRQAIQSEPVVVNDEENTLFVNLGQSCFYNPGIAVPSIGFSWQGGHEIRSTDDSEAHSAWKHLLKTWEFGGTFSNIRSRKIGGILEPEKNVRAIEMSKTIPQHNMFKFGGSGSRDSLKSYIQTEFSASLKQGVK